MIVRHSWNRTLSAIALAAAATLMILSTVAIMPVRTASAAFPGTSGQIAFASNRDGNYEIYVMNPDGTAQTRLTNNAADDRDPKWSPDGTKIAFSSNRDGNSQIYVMNADGTGQTNISKNGTANDAYPSWSPGGTKIAFERDGEIYVMNADGTGQTRLTNNAATDVQPRWSPDGKKMAFVSDRDGTSRVYVMNAADGSGQLKVSGGEGGADYYPDWSPDGTKIAFSSAGRQGPCCNIFTMNANGTNITGLFPGIYYNLFPSWSPNGTQIAFAGSYSGPQGDLEIYAMDDDGSSSSLKQLTINNSTDWGPDWGVHPLSPPPARSSLTVNSVDRLFNSPVNGMWTVIRTVDGTVVKSGFTPLTFEGDVRASYKVTVADYDDNKFVYWDEGSTSSTRTIALSADTTITATYDVGDALRGFTSLTYTGTEEQPDLTVNATTLDGTGNTLHMWTIIDPQSSSASGTTYRVYASNYQDKVFDHWNDGSTDRVRNITISEATTITAYYRAG